MRLPRFLGTRKLFELSQNHTFAFDHFCPGHKCGLLEKSCIPKTRGSYEDLIA